MKTRLIKGLSVAASAVAGTAHAATDVTAATTAITEAGTALAAVGAAYVAMRYGSRIWKWIASFV